MEQQTDDMESGISLDIKKSLVKSQSCFKELADDEITQLAELFSEEHIAAGNIVVAKGAAVDYIYLIVSGDADVIDSNVSNGQIVWSYIASLGPSQSIGLSETGFYSLTGKRTATVVSLSDMVLISLSVARLNGIILANSNIAKKMHKFEDRENI